MCELLHYIYYTSVELHYIYYTSVELHSIEHPDYIVRSGNFMCPDPETCRGEICEGCRGGEPKVRYLVNSSRGLTEL